MGNAQWYMITDFHYDEIHSRDGDHLVVNHSYSPISYAPLYSIYLLDTEMEGFIKRKSHY